MAAAAALPPLTVVRLPPVPSPLVRGLGGTGPLSLRQALDLHASTPCLLHVRARVLRAYPSDPRLWTCRERDAAEPRDDGDDGDDGGREHVGGLRTAWRYRMVLQLADVAERDAYIGAVLDGAEAEQFFHGLPAANLRESNATLAALQARVGALCADDREADFALWACRPQDGDRSESGVAYHIVGTECLIVNAA